MYEYGLDDIDFLRSLINHSKLFVGMSEYDDLLSFKIIPELHHFHQYQHRRNLV
jgi:hypothetical protein